MHYPWLCSRRSLEEVKAIKSHVLFSSPLYRSVSHPHFLHIYTSTFPCCLKGAESVMCARWTQEQELHVIEWTVLEQGNTRFEPLYYTAMLEASFVVIRMSMVWFERPSIYYLIERKEWKSVHKLTFCTHTHKSPQNNADAFCAVDVSDFSTMPDKHSLLSYPSFPWTDTRHSASCSASHPEFTAHQSPSLVSQKGFFFFLISSSPLPPCDYGN